MGYRLTQHNSRTTSQGTVYNVRHNDRNEIGPSDHINSNLSDNNITWSWDSSATFEESERQFYDKYMSDTLKAYNDKQKSNRHPTKTMDEWRSMPRYCPEETLYYIGSRDGHVDPDTLRQCVKELLQYRDKTYPNVKTLDYALHLDEPGSAPHIHERHVWTCLDPKTGLLSIGQNKSLEQMGIQAPAPHSPITRYNNAKVTYSQDMRDRFAMICKDHGLDVITQPRESSKSGLSQLDYKMSKTREKLAQARTELRQISDIKDIPPAEERKQSLLHKDCVLVPVDEYNRLYTSAHAVDNVVKASAKAAKQISAAKTARRDAKHDLELVSDIKVYQERLQELKTREAKLREDLSLYYRIYGVTERQQEDTLSRLQREAKQSQDLDTYHKLCETYPQEMSSLKDRLIDKSKSQSRDRVRDDDIVL